MASPAVEDAHKSDAIPFTRPRARPAHRGRGRGGKGKSRAREPRTLHPCDIEDICANNDEQLRAYCFCCLALVVDEFRLMYTPPADSDVTPVLTAKGKSAQDVFGECILRKNRGPDFVRKAGPEVFHTEEELHSFLVQAAGAATAHIDYSREGLPEQMDWLSNMPADKDAGWGAGAALPPLPSSHPTTPPPPTHTSLANVMAEADQALGGWKDARRQVTVHLPEGQIARQTNLDGSLTTLPRRKEDRPAREGIQLDPRADRTEHVMIINRQVQHVGWSGRPQNQFAALEQLDEPPAVAEDPSEVDPNA
jgi:hypothetical protein